MQTSLHYKPAIVNILFLTLFQEAEGIRYEQSHQIQPPLA